MLDAAAGSISGDVADPEVLRNVNTAAAGVAGERDLSRLVAPRGNGDGSRLVPRDPISPSSGGKRRAGDRLEVRSEVLLPLLPCELLRPGLPRDGER